MDIENLTLQFGKILRRLPNSSLKRSIRQSFDETLALYAKAADDAQRSAYVATLLSHIATAESLSDSAGRTWRIFAIILILLLVVLFFGGIAFFFQGIGPEKYSSIEATRPILVFTLIVSMLGFGGVLIARPLFSNEELETLESRFQMSREVFLVFAGIFGTIIGFYFGAGDKEALADAPRPAIVSHSLTTTGRLTVNATGGSKPYAGSVKLLNLATTRPLEARDNILSLQFDTATDCAAGAIISITDSRQQAAITATVVESRESLFAGGWKACAAGAPGSSAETPAGGTTGKAAS